MFGKIPLLPEVKFCLCFFFLLETADLNNKAPDSHRLKKSVLIDPQQVKLIKFVSTLFKTLAILWRLQRFARRALLLTDEKHHKTLILIAMHQMLVGQVNI